MAYAPNSPYAASKAALDYLVRAHYHGYGFQVTRSNCSKNFGPYQFPGKCSPLIIVIALVGKPMPVYRDGSRNRDLLFIENHVCGIDLPIKDGAVRKTCRIGGKEQRANSDNLLCRNTHRVCVVIC